MRKRVSRDKELKSSNERRFLGKQIKSKNGPSPLNTLNLLIHKTQCLKQVRQFEKMRIQGIVRGGTRASVQFQQSERVCCFEEYLRKYYSLTDIRHVFTGLIKRSVLAPDITYIDFKLRHYRIMNSYATQLRRITFKDKEQRCESQSLSSTKEDRFFKEMQMCVKKMTRKRANSARKANSGSISYIQVLAKNIQKMIKNIKDPRILNSEMDFKPILHNQHINTPDISNIYMERLHTSPETQPCDSYGLTDFRQRYRVKAEARVQKVDIKVQKSNKEGHRYQTEYDTDFIKETKSKSKKASGMKSMSKSKALSKRKSAVCVARAIKEKK